MTPAEEPGRMALVPQRAGQIEVSWELATVVLVTELEADPWVVSVAMFDPSDLELERDWSGYTLRHAIGAFMSKVSNRMYPINLMVSAPSSWTSYRLNSIDLTDPQRRHGVL